MDPFVKGQKIVIHGVWNVPFLFNQPSRREESKTRTHVLFKFYHGEKSVSGRQNQPEHSVTVWFAEELVLVHLFSEAHSAELVHLQSKIDLVGSSQQPGGETLYCHPKQALPLEAVQSSLDA